MKVLARIFALFLIMPVVELALLVQVDKLIGFGPTIGLILFTGVVGGILAKREGLSVWRRLNLRLTEGNLPGRELIDGVIILVAGALLITPGVVTDLIGFMGLFPVTRAVIRKLIMKRLDRAVQRGAFSVSAFDGWSARVYSGFDAEGQEEPRWQGAPNDLPRHTQSFGDPKPDDGIPTP